MSVNESLLNKERWQDLAICQYFSPGIFFEEYESDERTARLADDICLSCPVRRQCLGSGIENNEWGVWGGIFLSSGKIDTVKNSHKTPEIWKQVREGLA